MPGVSPCSSLTLSTGLTEATGIAEAMRHESFSTFRQYEISLDQMPPEFRHLVAKYPYLQSGTVKWMLILTSSDVVYSTVYALLAIVGIAFPLLYCFHLFGILTAFRTLRNISRAVQDTWGQLLLVAALVLFVIYCYAVVAFVYFRQYFVTSNGEFACNTLSACLYFTLEWGLLNGGGIGNAVEVVPLEVPNADYVRQVSLQITMANADSEPRGQISLAVDEILLCTDLHPGVVSCMLTRLRTTSLSSQQSTLFYCKQWFWVL